jgi:hypothetical protein
MQKAHLGTTSDTRLFSEKSGHRNLSASSPFMTPKADISLLASGCLRTANDRDASGATNGTVSASALACLSTRCSVGQTLVALIPEGRCRSGIFRREG